MASVPGFVTAYDFKAARERVDHLTRLYRLAKHQGNYRACELLAADIQEIEIDIQQAHGAQKGRVTALAGSHSAIIIIGNILSPIVQQWVQSSN